MTRSNSIPTQDASLELYGASPLGSTLSLAERPRSMGMVRSGSFRDRDSDEGKSYLFWNTTRKLYLCLESRVWWKKYDIFFVVHGSVLSLASNASSSHSSVSVSSPLAQVSTDGCRVYLYLKVCWCLHNETTHTHTHCSSYYHYSFLSGSSSIFSPSCLANILNFVPPASEGRRENSRRSKHFLSWSFLPVISLLPSTPFIPIHSGRTTLSPQEPHPD